MPAIQTFALEKWYQTGFWRKRARCALRPLNLSVEEGEIFGYLGPNGAGKTTTLKLLMGLIFPTAGSAQILGGSITDPRVRAQIGFLPEQPYFYDYLTAHELLDYCARLSGVPVDQRKRCIEVTLDRVGLPGIGSLQLRKFSKGMLQRVGIAQAILHQPRLVFLDEPMSGLDPIGRREVRDLIQNLKDEGTTVFFSTHILSDAEALCDRVAVLNHGELRGLAITADLVARATGKVEILFQGTTPDVLRVHALETHTGGEVIRVIVMEDHLDAALETLRRDHARLISVTPVRSTLEDYFVERLAHPVEATP